MLVGASHCENSGLLVDPPVSYRLQVNLDLFIGRRDEKGPVVSLAEYLNIGVVGETVVLAVEGCLNELPVSPLKLPRLRGAHSN